ncbi:MAG: hypothetical protein AAF636_12790 [Pseudomonadota bacterium]
MTDFRRLVHVGIASVFRRCAFGIATAFFLGVVLIEPLHAHTGERPVSDSFIQHCLDPVAENGAPDLNGLSIMETPGESFRNSLLDLDGSVAFYGREQAEAESENWRLMIRTDNRRCGFFVGGAEFETFAQFVGQVAKVQPVLFNRFALPVINDAEMTDGILHYLRSTADEGPDGMYIYLSVRFIADFFVVTVVPFEDQSAFCAFRTAGCL